MVSANIFRTNLENKIGFSDAREASKKLGYSYEWENIGDTYTHGVELSSDIMLNRVLDFELDFGYTDAQYDEERLDWVEAHEGKYASDSKYIPRVPEITGGVKFGFKPGNWNAVLHANFTGRMYIDYYEEEDIDFPNSKIKHTENFWVLNTRLSRQIPKYGITAFVGVKNIFNYVQDEKHPDDAAFMYAPYIGRIVYSGVEVDF